MCLKDIHSSPVFWVQLLWTTLSLLPSTNFLSQSVGWYIIPRWSFLKLNSTHWNLCDFLNCDSPRVSHYSEAIMGPMASQITSLTIIYSIVYWGADQRKHQSSASLAFVRGIHRWPVNSPHKGSVTRKMFTFDDVIMFSMQAEQREFINYIT